jgi:hypothetical protein
MSDMIGGTAGQLAGIATGTGTAYRPTGLGQTSQVGGILNRATGDDGNLAGSVINRLPVLGG